MTEFAALLAAYREATGCDAAVWEERAETRALLASSSDAFEGRCQPLLDLVDRTARAEQSRLAVLEFPMGDCNALIVTEAASSPDAPEAVALSHARLLGAVVALIRRLIRERDGATNELADRYEEINLLYAIGELLGGTASVESVADTLLRELAVTVGASRAVFLLTSRVANGRGLLEPIASLGIQRDQYPSVAFDDAAHIAATVFRTGVACTEEGADALAADPALAHGGRALLAVAISRPSSGVGITGQFQAISTRRLEVSDEHSSVPLGVLVLGGRASGSPFSAGDRKLAAAVGTQIGIALHNAALVRSAMERQQLLRELRLAHELQLKLLPDPRVVEPEARAAARVVPAESVGGDFYLLARLDVNRTAVLIGDVSGHGYQAALVMALSLSAAAIHVQAAFDPAIALEAVRRSLADELTSTDMSLSLCYALIDSEVGELRYANAGHPHAFRLSADGGCERLSATVPPLGFGDDPIVDEAMPWRSSDRLVLFTDGLPDARDPDDRRLGERAVLDTLGTTRGDATPAQILEALLERVDAHINGAPLRDDLAVIVVDRPGAR